MRHLLVAGLVLTGGCSQVFGLDELTAPAATDAATDAAIDADRDAGPTCVATSNPGPPGSRRLAHANGRLLVEGAAAVGDRLALAGVFDLAGLDGLVVRRDGATAEAWTIGGLGGDQLLGAAGDGATMLAVGVSRTGLIATQPDRGLLVWLTADGAPQAKRLYDLREHLLATTVTRDGVGWLVAGRTRTTATASELWIARLGTDGAPLAAVRVPLESSDDARPRAFVTDGVTGFVVGSRSATAGFVVAYASDGSVPWVAHLPFQAVGAAVRDDAVWVVGIDGPDGVIVHLNRNTGAMMSGRRLPNVRLHGITSGTDQPWLTGPGSGGIVVGRLAGDCLTAAFHGGLGPPTQYLTPVPLVVHGTTATLVATSIANDGAVIERLLDDRGASSCTAAWVSQLAVDDTLAVDVTAASGVEALTLSLEDFAPVVATTVTATAACN